MAISRKRIKIPIYNGLLIVYVVDTFEDWGEIKDKYNVIGEYHDTQAMIWSHDVLSYRAMFRREFKDINVIAHEAYHLMNKVIEDIDAEVKDDEPSAYLVGWFTEQLYNILHDVR